MSQFFSDAPGEKGILRRVLEGIAAIFIGPFYVPARLAWEHTYQGSAGGLSRAVLAIVVSFWAATNAGSPLDGLLGVLPQWLHGSTNFIFVLLATFFYVFPAMYWLLYKPLDFVHEQLRKLINTISREVVQPLINGFVDLLGYLPLAGRAWAGVHSRKKGSWSSGTWFIGMTAIIGALTLLLGSWRMVVSVLNIAWAHLWTANWVTLTFSQGAAALAALFVPSLVVYAGWSLLEKNIEETVGVVGSALATYALAPYSVKLLNAAGFAVELSPAVYALEFFLTVAYIFPSVDNIIAGGLIKELVKAVNDFADRVYSEKEGPFRKFVQQLTALVFSSGCAWLLGYKLGLWLTLPAWGAAALAALTFIGTYGETGDSLERRNSNGNAALLASVPLSIYTGWQYSAAGLPFGYFGAIAAGLVSLAALMWAAWPASYRLLSFIVPDFFSQLIAEPLYGVNRIAYNLNKAYSDFAKTLEKAAYEDKTTYHELLAHLVTLAATGYVFYFAYSLKAFDSITGLLLLVAGTGMAYLLAGGLLVSNWLDGRFKKEVTPLSVLGLAFACWLGVRAYYWAQSVQTFSFLLSLYIAYVVLRVGERVLFPALFAAAELLTNWEFAVEPAVSVLDTVYETTSNAADIIWQPVKTVLTTIIDWVVWVFKPVINLLNAALKMLEGIFGRRR